MHAARHYALPLCCFTRATDVIFCCRAITLIRLRCFASLAIAAAAELISRLRHDMIRHD